VADEGVEDFAYLWTTERDDWVVLRAAPDESGMPYNRVRGQMLLIDEDDDLYLAVVRRMVAEGMRVVTKPPE
jgi:hypothetical protein